MKWIYNIFIIACWALLMPASGAQNAGPPLDWPAFRQQMLGFNPLIRQADLITNQAESARLRAWGGFDPKVFADHTAKEFNGKNYFQFTETGVKVPTWLGLEFKGSYNIIRGDFVNPENSLPNAGQAALGLIWTLGQGLFIDERRAGLQQARIGIQQAQAERDAFVNDLLLEAAKIYWTWTTAHNQLTFYTESLRQARIRHEALRESFIQGDKPGIDTVETFIQLQNREMDVYLAQLDVQNAGLALTNLLWNANYTALEPNALPAAPALAGAAYRPVDDGTTRALLQQARSQHPSLRYYANKLQILDVERRLKLEKRKPVLDVNYNILGSGWNFFPTAGDNGVPSVLANDIKWGVNFSFPLLNRKARGDYQITRLKIEQTGLELRQKQQEIENKVQQYANELNTLARQIELFAGQVARYQTLLDAEIEKFNFGESSIFLINSREQRLLDAQIKYLKLMAEYRKAEAGLQWAAGNL